MLIETNNLSEAKRKLIELPDKEVMRILDAARKQLLQEKPSSQSVEKRQVGKERIPEHVWHEYNKMNKTSRELDDIRWQRYVEEYASLQEKDLVCMEDPKELYKRLKEELERNDISSTFAEFVIPILLAYIENPKNTKPILLLGSPGSGKTYTAKMLAEFLKIPVYYIFTPELQAYHGLTGDSRTYKSADIGALLAGILKTRCLSPVYILDEVDKCPSGSTEKNGNIQDQLLRITDPESRDSVFESFLGLDLDCSKMLFVMTANDINDVTKPLQDRCYIYHFPEVDCDRMKTIISKFAQRKTTEGVFMHLVIDHDALKSAVEKLFAKGVRSVRKYEEMVNHACHTALTVYLENDRPYVTVNSACFEKSINSMGIEQQRKIGFG